MSLQIYRGKKKLELEYLNKNCLQQRSELKNKSF